MIYERYDLFSCAAHMQLYPEILVGMNKASVSSKKSLSICIHPKIHHRNVFDCLNCLYPFHFGFYLKMLKFFLLKLQN